MHFIYKKTAKPLEIGDSISTFKWRTNVVIYGWSVGVRHRTQETAYDEHQLRRQFRSKNSNFGTTDKTCEALSYSDNRCLVDY